MIATEPDEQGVFVQRVASEHEAPITARRAETNALRLDQCDVGTSTFGQPQCGTEPGIATADHQNIDIGRADRLCILRRGAGTGLIVVLRLQADR